MDELAVWIVALAEGCDSSGGSLTMLVITRGPSELPDVQKSFRRVRKCDSCEIYEISNIRLLGTFKIEGFLLVDPGDFR